MEITIYAVVENLTGKEDSPVFVSLSENTAKHETEVINRKRPGHKPWGYRVIAARVEFNPR